jgi:hypothetical protein
MTEQILMEGVVTKINTTWTSSACSCCPHDMMEAIVLLTSGEEVLITSSLHNVGDAMVFDGEIWIEK